MTNKQQHKVYSAMMRNDKVDTQVAIKLSNISNEKVHVSPVESKRDETLGVQVHQRGVHNIFELG